MAFVESKDPNFVIVGQGRIGKVLHDPQLGLQRILHIAAIVLEDRQNTSIDKAATETLEERCLQK